MCEKCAENVECVCGKCEMWYMRVECGIFVLCAQTVSLLSICETVSILVHLLYQTQGKCLKEMGSR